ncbi:MAG: CoA transferase [Litorivicinus sp.]
MSSEQTLPLTGLKVVDFGQQIAAPAVAMALADMGATVVHIDPPQGPMWQSSANAVLNRNKSCLRLDLKTEQGLRQAHQLIEQADIVIEGFRPGVMARLGIDFQALRRVRPQLITLSIPGFASNDQLRRDWKATESVVAASCGAFTDMGFNRVLMGVNPSFSPLPLGSSYAISLACASVALALFHRQTTGRGDHIEVPIAAALMEGLSYNSYVIDGLPERYKTMREHEIEMRRQSGQAMDLSYDELQEYLDPFFRTYPCADGRFFYCVCPSHRNHARRALEVLDIYDELVALGLPEVDDLYLPCDEWEGETSIGVYPLPQKWAGIIAEKMKAAFLTRTSEEWGQIFADRGIPGAPHRSTQEWVNDEHTNAAGIIVEVDDVEYGRMKQPGPLAWFEHNAEQMLTPRSREWVDFETAFARLSEMPFLPLPAPKRQAPSAWLDGVKVLDLTNVIAGPHSAAFLTRFGAEVTKLDPIHSLYDPLIGVMYAFQSGVGKRSALVDITTLAGREVFERLVRESDIVVMNAPERQIGPLGLDEQTLSAINPNVIFCRLDCLGGPRRGPKSDAVGYDDIIQAYSGIMSRFGGPQTPEEHAHIGTLDVNCGFAAGFGMGLALYKRARGAKPARVRTSLSVVTNMAQLPYSHDYDGRADFNEPSGREAMGFDALSHFYPCAQGWLYLDATPADLPTLERIPGLEGLSAASDRHAMLSKAFSLADSDTWLTVLRGMDLAAAQPVSIEALRENYSRLADGRVGVDQGSYAFSIYPDHPSGHQVTQIDPYAIRPTEAPIVAPMPAERFGASTREILQDLGYSEFEIQRMLDEQIVGLGWGREYLPSDSLSEFTEKLA